MILLTRVCELNIFEKIGHTWQTWQTSWQWSQSHKRVAFRRRSHSLVRVAMAVVALVAVVAVTIAGFVAGPVARESPPMLVVVMVVRVLVGSVGSVGIYKGLPAPKSCDGKALDLWWLMMMKPHKNGKRCWQIVWLDHNPSWEHMNFWSFQTTGSLRPQRCTGNTPVGRCSFSFLQVASTKFR